MKRKLLYIAAIMAIMMLFTVAIGACSNDEPTVTATPEATAPATEDPDTDIDTDVDPDTDIEENEGGVADDVPFYLQPLESPITLNVGMGFGTPSVNAPAGITPEEQTWNELVRDHLNIELNYLWQVPTEQAAERFQLAVSTGEIPDMMNLGRRDFAEFTQFDMLRDLTDAFERYARPEIKEMFAYSDNVHLELASRNGRLYGIPVAVDPFQQTQLLWYRHDWATELGFSAPTSMDELTEMAVAFVENDMSGQGNTTGIGMQGMLISAWMPDARGIFHGHGAYPLSWLERGGQLIPGIIQPEVQDALNTLRNMYSVGAVNREFLTMNMDQLAADIAGDRVGVVIGEWWLPAGQFNHNLEFNPEADWRATTIVTPDGTPGTTLVNRMTIHAFTTISANAPEGAEIAAIKMLNLFWDIHYNENALEIYGNRILPEYGFVYNWATGMGRIDMASFEQFLNFTMVNEAIATGDTSPLFTSMQQDLYKAHQIVNEGLTSEDMTFESAWGLYTSRVAVNGGWGTTMQVRDRNLFTIGEFYGDPTPTELSVASILADLWSEFAARYIMGDLPYDAWDTFVEDWQRLGGEAWTQEANEQFQAR